MMHSPFSRWRNDPKRGLRELLGDYAPPAFSSSTMELLCLLRDPESSTGELTQRIELDPGLHVRVLKTVNSAAFGLSTRVAHAGHAVNLLGRSRLETLVLSIAVNEGVGNMRLGDFDLDRFWRSAARRATLARKLAGEIHPATQAECFTAGLLQDVGVPLLLQAHTEAYNAIYSRWCSDLGTSLEALETEAFGYDHAAVGGLLAEDWRLPAGLVGAIAGHNGPVDGVAVEPAVTLVTLIRDSEECDGSEQLAEACVRDYRLAPEAVQELIKEAFDQSETFFDAMK
jgi:HD-like signal output (HDOD) protein